MQKYNDGNITSSFKIVTAVKVGTFYVRKSE